MAQPPVYSERFLAGGFTGSPLTYKVPAGKRAIVSCIDVFNAGASTETLYIQLAGVSIFAQPIPAGQTLSWRGHHVLYANESMAIGGTSGGGNGAASGYLFNDPA